MRVGTALNMLSQPGRSDASILAEHFALGDLAEPLGFDSLFALEHHFTGYAMSPAPLQLLAYFAGRTRRIALGTAVIVLPWYDPIRVAEGIALLDIMCGGRCLFGFGRGAASVEYEGMRIPMGEARGRFAEAAQIVVMALSQPEFEFKGEFFDIPRTSIRPRAISHPERRFYASSVSPESATLMAKLGFSMLLIMQNEWTKCAGDIEKFYAIAAEAGHRPHRPLILTNVSCAESRSEAQERALKYLGAKWDSIESHYRFGDGHLAKVRGYESYEALTKTYAKMKDPAARAKATEFYVSIQIVGTPDDCLQKIAELKRLTGLDHLICEFAWGGLPHEEAETNMRLFASQVLPVLQRDRAFATADATATKGKAGGGHENIFTPA
jgi:alkanesulfonate monooxygenase SsuD/methylene tetrahydromethanopterin reductase-like flavin-dependent oxidoreductase (luciferase family)